MAPRGCAAKTLKLCQRLGNAILAFKVKFFADSEALRLDGALGKAKETCNLRRLEIEAEQFA